MFLHSKVLGPQYSSKRSSRIAEKIWYHYSTCCSLVKHHLRKKHVKKNKLSSAELNCMSVFIEYPKASFQCAAKRHLFVIAVCQNTFKLFENRLGGVVLREWISPEYSSSRLAQRTSDPEGSWVTAICSVGDGRQYDLAVGHVFSSREKTACGLSDAMVLHAIPGLVGCGAAADGSCPVGWIWKIRTR